MSREVDVLAGVDIIAFEQQFDDRGFFQRHFSRDRMVEAGLNPRVEQANVSFNRSKFTLRGFHYQAEPDTEDKTISVLRGELLLVVIDLDPTSATYLEHMRVHLTEFQGSAYIPKLKATAFLTLTDDVLAHYFMSSPFAPGSARGFRYDDPSFAIDWPHEPARVSDRDLAWPAWSATN